MVFGATSSLSVFPMAQRMMVCLAIAALAGAVSCTDAPTATRSGVSLEVGEAGDSLQLTYICGNMFRVRNKAFTPVRVRWDIYGAVPVDTGSLRVRGRDVGAASVDYYVTARTKGTMRLFVRGEVEETKANGNKVACAAPVDTSPIPSIRTSAREIEAEPRGKTSNGTLVARTVLTISFDPGSVSPASLRSLLQVLNAQIWRVLEPGFLDLRMPDRGASPDTLSAIVARAKSWPGITRAAFVPIGSDVTPAGQRIPQDGPGARSSDYAASASSVWPAQAMRQNAAWWCENGTYSPSRVSIAAMEANFPDSIPLDLAGNVALVQTSADTGNGLKPLLRDSLLRHGVAVASLMSAQGDNGIGIAGAVWKSSLTMYSLNKQGDSSSRGLSYFEKSIVPAIVLQNPRILSASTDFSAGNNATVDEIHRLERGSYLALVDLLRALPQLLIVKSADNFSYVGDYSNYPSSRRRGLLGAVIALHANSEFADRVLIVGSTDRNGARSGFSNVFTGSTDIYAPGGNVPVLLPNGSIGFTSGTSFSTPLVAGVAAQLLAMDPTLSAGDVKALLLAGAIDSVENSNGVNEFPHKVGNTSEIVYEADAYGSLRRLSSRNGTPLCGAAFSPWPDPARAAQQQAYSNLGTRAVRYGGANTEYFSGFTTSSQNLAPGGRLLSFAPAQFQQFTGTTWSPAQSYQDGYRRAFGERDSLTYRLVPRGSDTSDALRSDLELRLRPGFRSWKLLAALGIPAFRVFGQPSLSPSGTRVTVPISTDTIQLSASPTNLALADTTGVTSITLVSSGASPWGASAWRPDGGRAVYFLWGFPAVGLQTTPIIVNFGSGTPSVHALPPEPDRLPISASWSDEGNRLTVIDVRLDTLGLSDCRRRDFGVSSSALTLLNTTNLNTADFCASAG